jgi:hypothetical protein
MAEHPLILLLGSPRSGTTWLGKIFDSHPRVLYRHEPDSAVPCYDMPFLVSAQDLERYGTVARDYLARLREVRCPSVVGKRPLFDKSFRGPAAEAVRRGLIRALRPLEKAPAALRRRLVVPDMLDRGRAAPVHVIKSVISLGRGGLFHHADPDLRVVLIVRHPCGFVASRLRGASAGRMPVNSPAKAMAAAPEAATFGLTQDCLERLGALEQLAWEWTLFNHKLLLDLAQSDRLHVVLHDSLSRDTATETRRLYEFAGLEWNAQTEAFIGRSTSAAAGGGEYYGVERDSREEAEKWRRELSEAQIAAVMEIAGRSPATRALFAD